MKKAGMVMVASALFATPVQAADWNDVRPGTFVGARLTIGGNSGGRPRAALTIAPTQHRISNAGMTSMRIGEGIAFNLTPGSKPTFTLAGIRADQALGLTSGSSTTSRAMLGMSDEGKVAMGVGVALVLVAGGTYLVLANRCTECDQ